MRVALVAVLLLTVPAHAAQNATERARTEARLFLGRCPATSGEERQLCLANQAAFVWDYVSAKSGKYEDQLNIAYIFDHGPVAGGGVMKSDLQSCAWYLVALASGSPDANPSRAEVASGVCNRLPNPDIMSPSRAARIDRDMRTDHAHQLPGDSTDFYDLAQKGRMTENTFPLGEGPPPRQPRR